MDVNLDVANTLTEEEARRVILENQERLSKVMYDWPGIPKETLKSKIKRDVEQAKGHVQPLFVATKLAMNSPEQIVVYVIAGEPFCGLYDKTGRALYAERTVLGCDYVSAKDILDRHNGKVSMYHADFSGLLEHLMTGARLRVKI